MLEGYNIICFAPTDWWGMNPSCTTHIMRKLAGKNRILYINPFSSDLLGVKKGIGKRIPRKLKSIAMCLRQPIKNLYVFSPIFFPLHGKRFIDNINNVLLKVQIRLACRLAGINEPILWMENPRSADMIELFDSKLVVYHVSDHFDKCRYISNKVKLQDREKCITNSSDLLICVSQAIYEDKSVQHDNVFYLPHAVDYNLFRDAAENNVCLDELSDIPKPIIGYYGTMSASNDIELLLWCAGHLPEMSFVLAGQITGGNYSELEKLPNVYLLGKLPYEKIPALCAGFDVCMLQWKMTEWIRCCNPLKLMEYMASGRPIVSVPIDEVIKKYSDVVSLAYNKKEFCDAIVWELQNDTSYRSKKRIGIAFEHSWDKHIEKISQMMIDTMVRKKCPVGINDLSVVNC